MKKTLNVMAMAALATVTLLGLVAAKPKAVVNQAPNILWKEAHDWSITDSNVTRAIEFGFEDGGAMRWRKGRVKSSP